MGCNRTGPSCSVGAQPPARRPAVLQTTNDEDRRQQVKQYWPIRRASNNLQTIAIAQTLYIGVAGNNLLNKRHYI